MKTHKSQKPFYLSPEVRLLPLDNQGQEICAGSVNGASIESFEQTDFEFDD